MTSCLLCRRDVGHGVTRKTDNLELTDKQKTRLLNLALEPVQSNTPPDANEERGDLLCDVLSYPLSAASHPPNGTKSVPPVDQSVFGPTLGQLLGCPETDIAVLRQIKDYAKACGSDAQSDVHKDVFLVVYFAAIAGALAFHRTDMTEHKKSDLKHFFGQFSHFPWMPARLRDLFLQAIRFCSPSEQSQGTVDL